MTSRAVRVRACIRFGVIYIFMCAYACMYTLYLKHVTSACFAVPVKSGENSRLWLSCAKNTNRSVNTDRRLNTVLPNN